MGFKVLNAQMKSPYLASTNQLTFLDIMVFVEISQVLAIFQMFKNASKSEMY